MKNLKILFVTCLILSMFAMLVACGGDKAGTGTDTVTDESVTATDSPTSEDSVGGQDTSGGNTSGNPVDTSDSSAKNDGDDIIYDNF